MKFGGTSVATAEARQIAANRVVAARERGFRPVVVVSAIGRRGAPYATDTLIGLLREIDPTVAPDAREQDLLMACGEILSASVFAQTLRTLGAPGVALLGAQAGIFTDSAFGNARIERVDPTFVLEVLESGRIPVVCGFQGVSIPEGNGRFGEITTLGRGGSDTTAAALGAALQADAIEIYTDVDGVKTADPDMVPHAPTLHQITYDEVSEIAHLGAKVLHPRAAEIAMQYNIPLWVKSTFLDEPGTEVIARNPESAKQITGVTHTGKLVNLQFDLDTAEEEDRMWIRGKIYELMASFGVYLYMINVSPNGIGFAVTREQFPMVEHLLDGLVLPMGGGNRTYLSQLGRTGSKEVEAQVRLLEEAGEVRRVIAELTESCTMVSLVGNEYLHQPGVFYAVLSTLHEAQIPVLQTSDSDFSISCLIPEAETDRAVRLLHDRFDLASRGRVAEVA